jgi:hypothetical protein
MPGAGYGLPVTGYGLPALHTSVFPADRVAKLLDQRAVQVTIAK